jgi:hypothetical protein
MLRKLRVLFVALLLVPALVSNASAFTTAADDAGLNPSKPKAGWCWIYAGGVWYVYPC